MRRICLSLVFVVFCIAVSHANLTNTAGITYQDASGNNYTQTSNSTTVTVTTLPFLSIVKSASPTTGQSGTVVTYMITIINNSATSAASVVVTDVIPPGSTYILNSVSAGGVVSGGSITWTLGTLGPNGGGAQVSFNVRIN